MTPQQREIWGRSCGLRTQVSPAPLGMSTPSEQKKEESDRANQSGERRSSLLPCSGVARPGTALYPKIPPEDPGHVAANKTPATHTRTHTHKRPYQCALSRMEALQGSDRPCAETSPEYDGWATSTSTAVQAFTPRTEIREEDGVQRRPI